MGEKGLSGWRRRAVCPDQQLLAASVLNWVMFCAMRAQLEQVYGEVFRVLKPGGYFASYEWVATKDFDGADPEHVRIIDEINYGNGLPVGRPFSRTALHQVAAMAAVNPSEALMGACQVLQLAFWCGTYTDEAELYMRTSS